MLPWPNLVHSLSVYVIYSVYTFWYNLREKLRKVICWIDSINSLSGPPKRSNVPVAVGNLFPWHTVYFIRLRKHSTVKTSSISTPNRIHVSISEPRGGGGDHHPLDDPVQNRASTHLLNTAETLHKSCLSAFYPTFSRHHLSSLKLVVNIMPSGWYKVFCGIESLPSSGCYKLMLLAPKL